MTAAIGTQLRLLGAFPPVPRPGLSLSRWPTLRTKCARDQWSRGYG
jgi:hypothetical protein